MSAIPINRLAMAPSLRHAADIAAQGRRRENGKVPRPALPPPGGSNATRDNVSGGRDDLAGIEDVLRVERPLQRPHGVDRLGAEFGLEVFLLALPDAVLAGAGAPHRLR